MSPKTYHVEAFTSQEGTIPAYIIMLRSYESARIQAEAELHHNTDIVRVRVQEHGPGLFGQYVRTIFETRIPW